MKKPKTDLPPLKRDVAFWGMTTTQFLGAFNDNIYKQLVLLICVDYVRQQNLTNDPYQALGAALLAIPFVMFSGLAGFLSDKMSKRTMIIACKCAEILVMAAGMLAFMTGRMGSAALITYLLIVLFFMGMQSAFFGPSKYGILPEMLRDSDLPAANGVIQMTTFLAIIFGMGLGGILKQFLGAQLWMVSAVCIGIAVAGTMTSILVRQTPVANPGLRFSVDSLVIHRRAWNFLRADRPLQIVVGVYMLFWFSGNVVLLGVNQVCKNQLFYQDGTTSLMAACMGVGIALGCVVCGRISRHQIRFDLVRIGGYGVLVSLVAASLICLLGPEPVADYRLAPSDELRHAAVLGASLVVAGFFAGQFAVPLQVFIQVRPPEAIKGRVIGAMGLINWIGILISAGYYFGVTTLFGKMGWPISWSFVSAGMIMGAVALLFRLTISPGAQTNGGSAEIAAGNER